MFIELEGSQPAAAVKRIMRTINPHFVFFPQNFTLELRDSRSHRLILNVTSARRPVFAARGLMPSTGYIVSVFAVNKKGRSDRVNFHIFTR